LIGSLARIIKENIRLVDLAGHFNHRKFAIAFPDTGHKKAEAVCQRIQRAVSHHDWREVQPGLEITVSFVLTPYRQGQTLEELFVEVEGKLGR